MATQIEIRLMERIVDGLRAGNWDTVIGRWYQLECPSDNLTDEDAERITTSYLNLMAADIAAAIEA